MTPVRRILLVAALIMLAQASVLLQASALAASHYSVELAFENPVSSCTGVDHVFHAGTTLDSRSQLLAYAEYDSFVEGYGAFSVRKGSHIPGSFVGYWHPDQVARLRGHTSERKNSANLVLAFHLTTLLVLGLQSIQA